MDLHLDIQQIKCAMEILSVSSKSTIKEMGYQELLVLDFERELRKLIFNIGPTRKIG